MAEIPAHDERIHVDEIEIIDAHAPRGDSPLFDRNRALLVARLGSRCWVDNDLCVRDQPIEAHHLFPWAMADKADFQRLADTLLAFDPYGYSHAMAGQPISSIDDLRNLILVCPGHHRGTAFGLHHGVTFPEFLMMKARKAGAFITEAERAAAGGH